MIAHIRLKHVRTEQKSIWRYSDVAKGVKGTGISLVRTETHTFKGAGKWFRTAEEAERYRERNNVLRRAKRAGFGSTDQEIERFLKTEEETNRLIKRNTELKARERAERDELRQRYGLHPKAHVTGKIAAIKVSHESRVFMAKQNQARLSDSERLDYIRALYRQKNISQTDMLIRIGRLVGVM